MAAEREKIDGITTYAFVGSAGTGKSQRAQLVASFVDADYIIDDGLVISKGSIVCGRSAKSERNHVSAIRRAIFEFEDHRKEVVSFFRRHSPCSVIVIATSEGMALKILDKLRMEHPKKIIRIEDVATPEEITRARRERFGKGQHVIPVSHVLVRKNFAGKLVGQLRVFWKSKNAREGERTIVRPPFSFYGEVRIDPEAIEQIVKFVATRGEQVSKVTEAEVTPSAEDVLSIKLKLSVRIGRKNLLDLAAAVKESVAVSVRYFTGLDVKTVDIDIAEVLL